MGCAECNKKSGVPTWSDEIVVSTLPAARPGLFRVVPAGGFLEVGKGLSDDVTGDVRAYLDGVGPFVLSQGETLPSPRSGRLEIFAPGGTGTIRLKHFPAELVDQRIASNTAAILNNTKGGVPRGSNTPNRQALTTGVPGTYTASADTIKVIVRAKSSNAAVAYISSTVALVAAAGTRYELTQGDWLEIWKPATGALSFGFDGTTGDHLFIWEHKA